MDIRPFANPKPVGAGFPARKNSYFLILVSRVSFLANGRISIQPYGTSCFFILEVDMDYINNLGLHAKAASIELMTASTCAKNEALSNIAHDLVEYAGDILTANATDIENSRANGMAIPMIDRLTLTHERIREISDAVSQIALLPDPIGEIIESFTRPSGLNIEKKRVPIGVCAIIYESRPNVTADAACLCLKTSNAVILRGGSEAINSNRAIVSVMRDAVGRAGISKDAILLVEDTSRECAKRLMELNEYIDVLIPRGGSGLIKTVVENAKVPVIETGSGNCHIYVEKTADLDMAAQICFNAKCQRPSVCNAAETLLLDREIAQAFWEKCAPLFKSKNVLLYGCDEFRAIEPAALPATDEEYYKEFNDYIMAVKVVSGIDEAIAHITKYSTKHSEAIITNDKKQADKFISEVDAAAVYVNASTRFTDGFEFGFGAEIGISTQKIHARGPMGLKELTSYKYVIHGNGQIRG